MLENNKQRSGLISCIEDMKAPSVFCMLLQSACVEAYDPGLTTTKNASPFVCDKDQILNENGDSVKIP